MKKILSLVLAVTLALGTFFVTGVNAHAAKTYSIKEVLDVTYDDDDGSIIQDSVVLGDEIFKMTFSADKPTVGSTVTITKPDKGVELEVIEYDYSFFPSDSTTYSKADLDKVDSITYTLKQDCDRVSFIFSGYASVTWNNNGDVLRDYQYGAFKLSPVDETAAPDKETPDAGKPEPAPAPTQTPEPQPTPAPNPEPQTPAAGGTQYTVVKGDCLWNIAKKFLGKGSRYMEIANLNNIKNPGLISVGQVLTIPAK